jgi:hypothetical protein
MIEQRSRSFMADFVDVGDGVSVRCPREVTGE